MEETVFGEVLKNRCAVEEFDDLFRMGEQLDEKRKDGVTLREETANRLLRIRNKRGRLVHFLANRAQREFAERFGKRNIVLKARQLGITTYVAARFFLNTIMQAGTVTVQVAHDRSSAEAIFRIVRRFYDNLPEEMRGGLLRTSYDNARQLVFPNIDSEYRVESAADVNAGRGLTIQNLHCSEVARWPGDAAETLASLRAAVPAEGEIVLESTPNGAGGCFFEEWRSAEERGYTRHFFPWWWEENYQLATAVEDLTEEEETLVRAHGLTREQIAYRRDIHANFGKLARQEYAEDAESCFLASGECVFEVPIIERRLAELEEPVEREENGALEIYYPPVAGRSYAIGVDPAGGGTEGDYAAAEVIERASGMQCAELRGHYGPVELAHRVGKLGRRYNDALVAVERNNHGHAVLVALEQSGYENLYAERGQTGWLTTMASRPRMLERFAAELRECPAKFASRRLLEECKSFVRKEDGSASAASGAHDDLVMAMAVAVAGSCG